MLNSYKNTEELSSYAIIKAKDTHTSFIIYPRHTRGWGQFLSAKSQKRILPIPRGNKYNPPDHTNNVNPVTVKVSGIQDYIY
jgi:hypothetical protein